ncbi:centromere protein I-like isoform X1 [Vespula pensylvanica]|uniref:centromere protein I-like isoform X1 n=2 Tax=Vespula pensylvanica TaxID=30213 RepID=UPI001CBA00E7|nr:centromere protein I-like isoform X1 [Vespula pensylvanica]
MSICFMSNVYASVRTFVIKLKINCAVLTRMEEDSEDAKLSSKFLNNLKEKGKSFDGFNDGLKILQREATTKGLSNEDIDQLINIIIHVDFGAVKHILLIKCLVPIYKISNKALKLMITWCLSSLDDLKITVAIIIMQWIVGLWEYGLAEKKIISMYYDVFFHWMLRKEKLEKHIAQVIYILTKPEDVTRRNVSRILFLHKKHSNRQKHTTALLSLFKTYKPELVPERIETMNIESVWRPIPEILRIALKDAKDRTEMQQNLNEITEHFNWNISKFSKKREKLLLPSVGYFHIGSSIFKEKDAKSIFDVYSINELGQHYSSIELPCNAISLLVNMAGYHLLTYADFHFQSRFSYNLYNTLRRAFILERGKFSKTEMEKILDMTVEFSKYMQQGILVVNLFIDEYLYLNSREHDIKILELLQWMTFISITEVQQTILPHIKNMFYESSITLKCKIIETCRILITNIFINQGFDECCQKVPAPFLGQAPTDKITDIISILIKISKDLIITGLNAHSYNILLLSESLTFYEVLFELESRSYISTWAIAPAPVIYAAFATKNCAFVNRICALILRYLEMAEILKQQNMDDFNENIETISIYITDIAGAFWYNKAFSNQHDYFFKSPALEEFGNCNFNLQLNINNHYATLPYKHVITKEFLKGVKITTKEDAINVAEQYYPAVREFLKQVIPELQE